MRAGQPWLAAAGYVAALVLRMRPATAVSPSNDLLIVGYDRA